MNVSSLLKRSPVTAKPFDDLMVVSQLMRDEHVGAVIRDAHMKRIGMCLHDGSSNIGFDCAIAFPNEL